MNTLNDAAPEMTIEILRAVQADSDCEIDCGHWLVPDDPAGIDVLHWKISLDGND